MGFFRPPGCVCEKPGLKHNNNCYEPWMVKQPVNTHTCLTDPVVRATKGREHQHHKCGSFCPGPDSEAVSMMLRAYDNARRKGGGDDRPV